MKSYVKGDGGYLCLPLAKNILMPESESWKKVECKLCGCDCWESDGHRETMANEPELEVCCTSCALKASLYD